MLCVHGIMFFVHGIMLHIYVYVSTTYLGQEGMGLCSSVYYVLFLGGGGITPSSQ